MALLQHGFDFTKRYGLISWTGICLFTLLVYTFFHTGALLGEYVRPRAVGYIAAFGIEAGIIGMSVRIGQLLREGKSAASWLSLIWQGITLLFVLGVSAVANVAEGFAVKYGEDFTMAAVSQLDGVQVVVGLLATALIPVVVLSMSEIVSGEVKEAVQQHERELAHARQSVQRQARAMKPRKAVRHPSPPRSMDTLPPSPSAARTTKGLPHTTPANVSDTESLNTLSDSSPAASDSSRTISDSPVDSSSNPVPQLNNGVPALNIEEARRAKAEQDALDQEAREQYIYRLIKEGNDSPTWAQISRDLNVSRSTVYKDRERMVEQGVIREVEGRWTTVNGFHKTRLDIM